MAAHLVLSWRSKGLQGSTSVLRTHMPCQGLLPRTPGCCRRQRRLQTLTPPEVCLPASKHVLPCCSPMWCSYDDGAALQQLLEVAAGAQKIVVFSGSGLSASSGAAGSRAAPLCMALPIARPSTGCLPAPCAAALLPVLVGQAQVAPTVPALLPANALAQACPPSAPAAGCTSARRRSTSWQMVGGGRAGALSREQPSQAAVDLQLCSPVASPATGQHPRAAPTAPCRAQPPLPCRQDAVHLRLLRPAAPRGAGLLCRHLQVV